MITLAKSYILLAVAAIGVAQDYDYQQDARQPQRYVTQSAANDVRVTPVPILKQINRHNEDGSYTYGYEAADGSFKIETKAATGEVKGKYGYKDDTGKVRVVEYGANKYGFQPSGEGITVAPPTFVDESSVEEQAPTPKRLQFASAQRTAYRPTPAPQPTQDYDQYDEPALAAAPAPAPAPTSRPHSPRQPNPSLFPSTASVSDQSSYSALPQSYSAPQRPSYAAPQHSIYSASQQPSYSAPQQQIYSAPQQPSYSASQQPSYSASQYSTPAPFFRPAPKQQFFDFTQSPTQSPQYTQALLFSPAPPVPKQSRFSTFNEPAPVRQEDDQAYFPKPPPQRQYNQPQQASMLDELLKEYALPQGGAAALHDITFGSY